MSIYFRNAGPPRSSNPCRWLARCPPWWTFRRAQRVVAARVRAYMVPMTDQPAAGAPQASPADQNAECPHCLKPRALCVCEGITRIDNKVSLLILQHPQEQDRELGTARLTALHFMDALLKIGLSWPSLSQILGRSTGPQA